MKKPAARRAERRLKIVGKDVHAVGVKRKEAVDRPLLCPAERNPHAPDRNDPCPCGSGQKWKNCHGITDVTARARAVYRRMDVLVEERKTLYSMSSHRAVPCRKGCHECCFSPMLASETEGIAFAGYLREVLEPPDLEKTRRSLVEWFQQVSVAGMADRVVDPEPYHRARVACPFLDRDNGTCEHYRVRPVVCRTYLATDRDECLRWLEGGDRARFVDLSDIAIGSIRQLVHPGYSEVSYWLFWVGKHLGCAFGELDPPRRVPEEDGE